MNHDFLIHHVNGGYAVLDSDTRQSRHRTDSAAAALQFAVDATGRAGGGAIEVASGTYLLDEPLRLRSRTTLLGRGPSTLLGASPTFAGEALLLAEDCQASSIRNLTVSGLVGAAPANGVRFRRSPHGLLENVAVGGTAGAGFVIEENSILTRLTGCTAAGNARCGFLFRENFRGPYGDFVPVSAQNCLVYGGGKGFEFDRCIVANITGCSVYQTAGFAFHLYNMSNSVLLAGCRTFQIGSDAYVAEESNEINLSGNVFCWHEGVGIRLRRCCWGTISGNEIIDTGSFNPDCPDLTVSFAEVEGKARPHEAIVLEGCRGLTVSANALFNWHVCPPLRHGIREDDTSGCNTFSGNNINYLCDVPVLSAGAGSLALANTSHAEKPHVHYYGQQVLAGPAEQKVQSFQPALTRQLIREIFGAGATDPAGVRS